MLGIEKQDKCITPSKGSNIVVLVVLEVKSLQNGQLPVGLMQRLWGRIQFNLNIFSGFLFAIS